MVPRQQAFPSLAFGELRASRTFTRALLTMHHPIGASTGYMTAARADWEGLVQRAVAISTFAVELSALAEDELPGLLAFLEGRPRLPFHYVAVHAPTKSRRLDEAALVAQLCRLPAHVDAVIVHPDQVRDTEVWAALGRRLVLENMDPRKGSGQTPGDLEALYSALPEAGFCFDVAHAAAVDPTMRLAGRLLDAHGRRLRQVHLSSLRAGRGTHVPLYRKDELRFAGVLRRCPDVPWILEAPPPAR